MMKRNGPMFTLVAGLLLAAFLMALNLTAGNNDPVGDAAASTTTPGGDVAGTGGAPTATTPPAAPPTTPPTTPADAPPAPPPSTYAGNVTGGNATLAIAVKDGKAIAYLCDGRRTEAWLQGTASGGALDLSGAELATLRGTYGNGVAAGQVRAAGQTFEFSIATVAPPSGLYRATADVRGASLTGGWIVLANGTQVGLAKLGGQTVAVSTLDPASRTATVQSTTVTAVAVDGTSL